MNTLDEAQQRAFQVLTASFVLTFFDDANDTVEESDGLRHRHATTRTEFRNHKRSLLDMVDNRTQLIMFLTGPGGSGKSRVINEVLTYAKEYCMNLKVPFTTRTILVCGMSGVAATLINGETAHSALHLNTLDKNINDDQMAAFKVVRLIIIDEISFAGIKTIKKIDGKSRFLANNFGLPYGGKHIAFMGDFRQLMPPTGDDAVYKDPTFTQWHTYINCFVELNGMFRFEADPDYGHLLNRFRNGEPTENDFILINERVLAPGVEPPHNIPYASFTNKERDSINTASFLKQAQSDSSINSPSQNSLIILLDHLEVMINKEYKKSTNTRKFYEFCGEDDIDLNSGRLDPALKVYRHCPLMLTVNKNVIQGQANGTEVRLLQVVLKDSVTPTLHEIDGTKLNIVSASHVDHLLVMHTNLTMHNTLGPFKLTPQKHTFVAKMPTPESLQSSSNTRHEVKMRGIQFTVVSNTATTGHKLQGKSQQYLYISAWSYTKNWPYVMLSRVTTRSGLYLGKALDPRKNYSVDPLYSQMIQAFRSKQPLPYQLDM
jgi:Cdc6-like AAA superfamily ATPase